MDIIRPAHNLKAHKVKSWKEIKKEALELKSFIKFGKYEGYYDKAFAISHAQVSKEPKNFFVINPEFQELEKLLGHWCIINLKILEGSMLAFWDEGCMSFPYRQPKRKERYHQVRVRYYTPSWFGLRRRTKTLKGLPAYIAQHEEEHSRGSNIYGLK